MLTREERVAYCRVCIHRKPSRDGLLCGLTDKLANFEETCPDFQLDKEENEFQLVNKLKMAGDDAGNSLHAQQNIQNGLLIVVFGLLLSIITIAYADEVGIVVLPAGAIFFGLRMYYRGKEQEEVIKEYFKNREDTFGQASPENQTETASGSDT